MKTPRGLLFGLGTVTIVLGQSFTHAQDKIYWTETREGSTPGTAGPAFIMQANADGSHPTELLSGAENILGPNGLEYGNGLLFWPDQQLGAVKHVKPDGSAPAVFAANPNPYDLFLASDKVYWTSLTGNSLDAAALDGTGSTRILSRSTLSQPFAVEATETGLFWSEASGSGKIRRADRDGSNPTTILNNVYVYDFQIRGDSIYLGDNNYPAAIKRAKLDGSGLVTLLPVDFVNGICVTDNAIYWSDLHAVNRADLTGANPVVLYASPVTTTVRGIVVLPTAAPSGPSLSNVLRSETNLVFTVQAPAGKSVSLEVANALGKNQWTSVKTVVAADQPVTSTFPISKATPAQFYRARTD